MMLKSISQKQRAKGRLLLSKREKTQMAFLIIIITLVLLLAIRLGVRTVH
jgi:hypothetical protein